MRPIALRARSNSMRAKATAPSEPFRLALNDSLVTNDSRLQQPNATDYEWTYEEYRACKPFADYLQNVLLTYYVPLLVVFGLLGNLLSCVVFLSSPLKAKSSSYYLAALAVADSGFLFNVLVVQSNFQGLSTLYASEGWCQAIVYASSVFATVSVWLVVGFTVERFIAVCYPFRRMTMCTVARAKHVICTLTALTCLLQLYVFWTAGVLEGAAGPVCEMLPDYVGAMVAINFVDTLATLIVPCVVVVTMNALMARSIYLARTRFAGRADIAGDALQNENSYDLRECTPSTSRTCRAQLSSNNETNIDASSNHFPKITPMRVSRTRNKQNTTKMLMVISTVFLCLNFPSYGMLMRSNKIETVLSMPVGRRRSKLTFSRVK